MYIMFDTLYQRMLVIAISKFLIQNWVTYEHTVKMSVGTHDASASSRRKLKLLRNT